MEWVLAMIAYLVLRLITTEFGKKPQDPPGIKEPEVDRKKLDE